MGVSAGPNVVRDSDYQVHLCTSSGTFLPNFTGNIEVLVVAGGGGGGMDMGGGGGGVLTSTTYAVTAGTPITVTVGAGGVGGPSGGPPQPWGHQFTTSATSGSNSVFGSLTAIGGGYGGSSHFGYTPNYGYGANGGSGGGASGYSDGNTGRNGLGTVGQGNDGGSSVGQYSSDNGCEMYGVLRGNDAYRNTPGFSMQVDTWYHFVMVNDYPNAIPLFVNGSQYGTTPCATEQYNPSLNAGNIGVSLAQIDGGGTANYSHYSGQVSVAKIYNRALSSNEIIQNFNAQRGIYGL